MLCSCLLWTVVFAIAHNAICRVTTAYGQAHSAECSALTLGCEAISTMESSTSQYQQDQSQLMPPHDLLISQLHNKQHDLTLMCNVYYKVVWKDMLTVVGLAAKLTFKLKLTP